jgi:hypothetical protein
MFRVSGRSEIARASRLSVSVLMGITVPPRFDISAQVGERAAKADMIVSENIAACRLHRPFGNGKPGFVSP